MGNELKCNGVSVLCWFQNQSDRPYSLWIFYWFHAFSQCQISVHIFGEFHFCIKIRHISRHSISSFLCCAQRDCLVTLDSSKSFECKECGTDIAVKEDIESKCYQVGQGQFTEKKRGYLFQNAVNTVLGATKTENFTTGSYQISWVSCKKCSAQMGWKYISADNPNNTTKVGKYCLARYSLTSPEDRATKKWNVEMGFYSL